MQPEFEAAVVGAGPAGATAARELAAVGVRTVLLERCELPRYKSCAGGIPVRTAVLLPFALTSVIEDRVCGLDISYRGEARFQRWFGEPFAFMVMRDRFDQLLTDEAERAGAEVLSGASVSDVERHADLFTFSAGGRRVSARFLIGADGANSAVAQATGLGHGLAQSAALEAEVSADTANLERWRGIVNVDFGYRPWGYGWVFPKQERLSVGLVLPREQGRDLRPSLYAYLRRLGLADAKVERLVGHKLLFRRGSEPIATDGAALAGDAAGLADEFTEEGIFYAIKSGTLVARAIQGALSNGTTTLAPYQAMVDREIMPELRAARTIARLFYGTLRASPRLVMMLSERIAYFWNAFFRVQRGLSTYDDELRRAWWLRRFLPVVLGASLGR